MVEKKNISCGVLPSRQSLCIGLYPRALPPVTQSSALQAPERLRRCIRLIRGSKESRGRVFILVYRLAMDAKTLQGDGVPD